MSISTKRSELKVEAEAKYERMWLLDPEQFNPNATAAGRMRVARTMALLNESVNLENKQIADLGSGYGVFSNYAAKQGAKVFAVDVASRALKKLDSENIEAHQQYVPYTTLPDLAFDVVLALDLIAEIPKSEYRIFFSELARLLPTKGKLLFSTAIDFRTVEALARLQQLAETEFVFDHAEKSYHAYQIRIVQFFNRPAHFVKAAENKLYLQTEMEKHSSLGKKWLKFNASKPMVYIWKGISMLTTPLARWINNCDWLTRALEKITEFLSDENGVSHVIILAHPRPLMEMPPESELPVERKPKKSVWE